MGAHNPLARLLPESYRTPEVEAKHRALFRQHCLDAITEKLEHRPIWPLAVEAAVIEPSREEDRLYPRV